MNSGQMYRVYRNQAATAYSSLYFFIFLSLQFSTLNFFITLFSGTARPRRLKLGTHVDSGQMYRIYWNQAAAANSSLYFFIFLLSSFQTLKLFVTLLLFLFRRLRLGTHMDSGWMHHVYQNQAAAAIRPFIFYFFFLQYSNIKNFHYTFLRNSET